MLIDNKTDTLTMRLLQEKAEKYAAWKGWFRDYKGHLKKPYDLKKTQAMSDATDDFTNEKPMAEYTFAKKTIGIDPKTFKSRVSRWINEGKLVESKDFIIDALGLRKWTLDGQEKVKECFVLEGGSL
jgi:hypothetical protein